MADFGPHEGDLRAHHGLVVATPGATANTKGSWASFGGGTPDRAEGFYFSTAMFGNIGTIRTMLMDIGVGSGPTPIISNLMVCPPHANSTTLPRSVAEHVFFPVALPPGETIKMRAQTNVASHDVIYAYIMPMKSGLPCVGSVVDTYGAVTSSDSKGTTLTAPNTDGGYGSWVPVSASCERIKALMVAVGHGQADWSTFGDQWAGVQVGIGGSGSEVEVVRIIDIGTGSGIRTPSQSIFGPYYLDIPAGTRLSARVAKQHASSSQRTIDVILYGIR